MEPNPYEAPEHYQICPRWLDEKAEICVCADIDADAYDDEMERRVDKMRDK